MNIVIITIVLPYPLRSGGAQAQYAMIDKLRKRHHISMIFPQNGENSLGAMKALKQLWPEVDFYPYPYLYSILQPSLFAAKARRAYMLKFHSRNERFIVERTLLPYGYPTNERFYRFLRRVIAETQADVVQTEFYPFLRLVHQLPKNVRKVFVHHELRYIRNQRLLANINLLPKEKQWMEDLKVEEVRDLNAYDVVVTLTDTDKGYLREMGVTSDIVVSPSTVVTQPLEYTSWNGKIIFIGGFTHFPNQEGVEWMLKEALPLIDWKQWPQVELDLIGYGWPETYERSVPGLTIRRLGFVEDLSEVARGSIIVVPILSGSGMRMKLVEAAAMSLPILTTTVGAEGLLLEQDKSALFADTPQDWNSSLLRLMSDEKLREQLGREAHHIYINHYSPEALSRVREQAYS